ncbi:MAG TPA: uracil-DNA glycosylase [Nocardioidaceae bacterium]|nr:uracil-DNA glycosylase [Nocardioidaceae bacterium]
MTGPAADGGALPHPATGQRFVSPVPPGTGWPEDPADPATPVATDAASVVDLSSTADLTQACARMSVCRACARLVQWREEVARDKRRAYAAQPYWGRPIAGWGAPKPRILIVGLAPAAHGGNRTGRVFTGDRSGDWLFASLHRVGLATQPISRHAGDGQRLVDTRMVAAVRCAPPDNKPTITERDTCQPWLHREIGLVANSVRCVVCLGSYGWAAALRAFRALGFDVPRPAPRFGHAVDAAVHRSDGVAVTLLGCYHPSQQNTFTGKLTEAMLDAVLLRAREDAAIDRL